MNDASSLIDIEEFRRYWMEQFSKNSTWFAVPKEKKCECGSEKARVAGHSQWCPKYVK